MLRNQQQQPKRIRLERIPGESDISFAQRHVTAESSMLFGMTRHMQAYPTWDAVIAVKTQEGNVQAAKGTLFEVEFDAGLHQDQAIQPRTVEQLDRELKERRRQEKSREAQAAPRLRAAFGQS